MMARPNYDAAELALSLLADMPSAERAEFLTAQLVKINDLTLLTTARNALTDAVDDMIWETYGVRE